MLPSEQASTHGEAALHRGSFIPEHKSPDVLVKAARHPAHDPDANDIHATLSTPVWDATYDGSEVPEYSPTTSIARHDTSAQLYTLTTPDPATVSKTLKSSLTPGTSDGARIHARLSSAPYTPPPATNLPTLPAEHISTHGDAPVHCGSLAAEHSPDAALA